METYAYLKQLEERAMVPANYLAGCPTNDKMRAVLIDWLIEVQIQFKRYNNRNIHIFRRHTK